MSYGGGYGGGYTTTSYGAQGAADGGGFMGEAQGGSQGGAGKGTYGKDTLRPVTIKQLVDAEQPHPDAEFKIDGVDITQVSFVGQIRNISVQTTNITYKLDDATGTMEVKQWVDADSNAGMDVDGGGGDGKDGTKAKPTENDWVRVWGRMKSFNNRRHVAAHIIRRIDDKMDIYHHLLESTYVHLYFTKGPLEQIKQEGEAGATTNGQQGVGADQQNNGPALPQMTPMARRVYETIRTSPQNNEGLHMQHIAALMNVNVAEVAKAGTELSDNGLIYTTMNDETWALMYN